MGNQHIKSDFSQVQQKGFEDELLNQYITKLWSFEESDNLSYKQISTSILKVGDSTLESQFPTQSTVEEFSHEKHGATETNFIKESTYMAGFTTGEKKIDTLLQEDIKQLRVENNAKAVEFESFVMAKIGILTAQLLARHKGGDSVDDWLAHAQKEEVDMGAATAMGNFFSSVLFCDVNSIETILQNANDFLKKILEALLEQARGTEMGKFCERQDLKKLGNDVKLQQIRQLLCAIINSSNSDKAMKTLAARLMLRLGYVFATAQDMLMAAEFQNEFKLDLTYDLLPLLDKSETFRKYIPPSKPGQGGDEWSKCNEVTIQSRVTFGQDRTQDSDQATCDANYYYMWSKERGMFKGVMRASDQYWEESKGDTSVKSIYKQVTFVRIDGKVYLRSGHLEDQPFVELDVETCKVKEGFIPWTSEDNLLNWSKTEVQSTIGDNDSGFRYLRPTQMHYNDSELWIVAPYYTQAFDSPIKRLVVEVYERQDRHFTRIQEIPLFKEDGITTFKGAKRRKHEYLDRGMLHKNAKSIILHSGKTIHVFDRQSGQRIHKLNWNSTTHCVFYNPVNNRFCWMDCACYSYLKVFDIKGYDPKMQLSKEKSLDVEPPILLDEIKQSIKNKIIEVYHEDAKPPAEGEEVKQDDKQKLKSRKRPPLHQVIGLMGLKTQQAPVEISEVPQIAEKIENAHGYTKAIIYSFCGVEANHAMKAAESKFESPPFGNDMLPFFKAPYSVYLNRDFILFLGKKLQEELQTSFTKTDVLNQVAIFSLLHFIQASFLSIKCCRMQAQQILSKEDILQFNDTLKLLEQVKPLESSKGKKLEELTKEESMQINISNLNRIVLKTLLSTLDALSSQEKLQQIQKGLNSENPESVHQLIVQLTNRDSLTKLFLDTTDLQDLIPALNGCCFAVNQSLKRVLNDAVTLKQYATDLDTDFAQAASALQSMLCKELCASYGNQLVAILENKEKAQGSKPDSMEEEEWNKIQSTYKRAVDVQKNIETILFQAFINISEHLKFQMTSLNQLIDEAHTSQWSEEDLKNFTDFLKKIFSKETSILRSTILFSLFFSSFEVNVTWLDEIAEGLKHTTTSLNSAILNLLNIQLDSNPDFNIEDNKFVIYLQKVLRQISYTIGWVAGRLIQRKQPKDQTLSKLNVLQGGIEDRFIPGLSDRTKVQIEGSFKITGDTQLQKLALSDASDIVLEQEDKLYLSIVDYDDSVKLILDVLHQSLLQKVPVCAFARLGGADGMTISRAAFAAIIKFTDKASEFEELTENIKVIASFQTSTGVELLKEIIQMLRDEQNQEYEALCKNWETANQMRKWTQLIKLSLSERIKIEEELALRNEINEANPSAEPFTGPFDDFQKQIIEERSSAKFDQELQKTYQGVVDKTKTLLKLQVPAAYKQKRGGNLAQLNRFQSQVLTRLQSSQSQLSGQGQSQMAKRGSIILIERQQSKVDNEFDWTDRLKQWKKVQMAEGAIIDLSAKGQLNSQSVSFAILGLLQSEFSADLINKTIEESLVDGLRRSAGLNLLNYAMSLSSNPQIFFDMIQWFSASLRQRKNVSVHILDGLTSCGNSCERAIRVQFFKILKKVDLKLRTCNDLDELKLLLNVLCWNFKAADHELLYKLNIFETLHRGDGSDLSWVKYNLGTYLNHSWNSKQNFTSFSSTNIGRTLQQTCEYLQNQVLSSIIQTEGEVEVIESKLSQDKMVAAQTTLDEHASKAVINQISSLVWSNIKRSVDNNRNQPCPDRRRDENSVQQRFTENDMLNQDSRNTRSSVYSDCLSSRPEIKTLADFDEQLNKRKKMESIKMRMLINHVDPTKNPFGLKEIVEKWLNTKAGPALSLHSLSQIVECVKARDLVVQELLQRTSFEELGLIRPKTEEERAAEAAAKAKEEAFEVEEIAKAKAKAESEAAEADARTKAEASLQAPQTMVSTAPPEESKVQEESKEQSAFDLLEETADTEESKAAQVDQDEMSLALIRQIYEMQTEKNCEICTFLNPVDAIKCSICDTQFPPETIRPVPAPVIREEVKEKEISEDESQLTEHQQLCKVIGEIGRMCAGKGSLIKPQPLVRCANGHVLEYMPNGIPGYRGSCTCNVCRRSVSHEEMIRGHHRCTPCNYDVCWNPCLPRPNLQGESLESTVFSDSDKRNFFGLAPQFRFLMQLEQLLGIAEKSALINSLIQDNLHPDKIKLLIELSVTAHPTIGQLVQRIFQIMLRMEVPHEIFETAIEACCRPDANKRPSKVAKLLARSSALSFPKSKFLQLLVNSVQFVVEKTTKRDTYAQFDFWYTASETTRTLRVLQSFPEKNQFLGKQLKDQLREALLSIESKSNGEVETIVNLIGEMCILNHFNIGSTVQSDDGDLYTVVENQGTEKNGKQSKKLIYCDPHHPERQQFVDGASEQVRSENKVSPQKLKPILDLNIAETEEAARNSVLVDPEVISKLLDIVRDSEAKEIGRLSKMTTRSLQTSVTRGFMNIFKTLKMEFMQLLMSKNLFEKLISYFVHVSGESSYPFKDQLRDMVQKEQQLQYRKQAWTSKGEPRVHTEVHWNPDFTSAIVKTIVFGYDQKSSELSRHYSFDFFKFQNNYFHKNGKKNVGRGACITSLTTDSKSYFFDQIEGGQTSPHTGLIVSSGDLFDMTLDTFYLLGDAETIFTDDETPMDIVITSMHANIKNNEEEFRNFRRPKHRLDDPRFIVLAKADFDRLHSFVDTNLCRNPLSTENVTTNERCLLLNDIARRVSGHYKSDAATIQKILEQIPKNVSNIPEDKTIQEVIDIVLEEKELTEEVKKMVRDIKDGVTFVSPNAEEKVEESKETLVDGISKELQDSSIIPNFAEMFLKSEDVVVKTSESINEQLEEKKYVDTEGQDFYGKEIGDYSRCKIQMKDVVQEIYTLYKVVNQSICRNTLINIMEVAGNRLNESAGMLLQSEELLSKLDDLLHNEHMVRSHQAICYDDAKALTKSENHIINALKLFKGTPVIKNFLIQDFFKRAKETIEKISREDFKNFFNSRVELVKNFRGKVELEAYLDPMNLLLLSTQFIEQNYIEDAKLPESLIAFIDLDLVYTMLLAQDDISRVSLLLIEQAKYHIRKVSQNLELFRGKTNLIRGLFKNGILKSLISKVTNFGNIKQFKRKQALFEIASQLNDLKVEVATKLGEEIALDLGISEEMQNYFTAITVLRDGTKFSTQIDKIKFATLVNIGDPQISHLATSYQTASKRFVLNFEKNFGPFEQDWTFKVSKHTSPEFIQVQVNDGRQIMVDRASLSAGSTSSIVCRAGQTMTIKFPVKPQIAKWIGFLKSRKGHQDKLQSLAGYEMMMQTAQISPMQVLGTSDHLTFVAADNSIYGMGGNIQNQDAGESEKFRKIPFPEGLSGADIKKIHIAKFARLILTNDGRFFHSGRHKYYMWGPTKSSATQADLDQFQEMNRDWFRNGEDRIVDWVGGCHYNVVLTESGKMICSSYRFYRTFNSEIRHNAENYEDWPFTVDAPAPCWIKAVKAFSSYKMKLVYVNWEKDDGSIRSFRVGEKDTETGESGKWHQLALPEGRYFKKIVAVRQQAWGICDQDKLWIWGNEIDNFIPKADGDDQDCFASREFRDPVLFKWFEDKNLKILDIKAGIEFAIVLTEDSSCKRTFYGVGKQIREAKHHGGQNVEQVNRFGENAKVLYGRAIFQIVDIEADQVASYACTSNSVAYLLKGDSKKRESIVPSKPDTTGLIHFYKKEGMWEFVTDDQYEEKKGDIPKLSFATRHSISDFSTKTFVDLAALESQINLSTEVEATPEYYSKYTVSDDDTEVRFVIATEKQAFEGGCFQDMNPVIYIRAVKPVFNPKDVIPQIKLTDFFEQTQSEEAIAFNIIKTTITKSELAQIEVKDEKSITFLEELKNFTSSQDSILISQIDKLAKAKSQTAVQIKPRTIEPGEFTWAKDSDLAKKDEQILKLRCKLLLKLVKSWATLQSISDLQDRETPGTIANILFKNKSMIPPSVLGKIVDQACAQIASGSSLEVSVSRRKAFMYADSGKIDHEGKYSLFGQIIQQLAQNRPDMSNFRIKSMDEKCYKIQFRGEGAIDAGGPFRESLTNIAEEFEKGVVPLLIRSPNNRNETGNNRDSYILNSLSTTPAHKLMFKYFGGFLAYAFLSKSPIPFNLAPWVWKQILQEQVTLNDLDGIDSYSSQVLRDLKMYAQDLSDEDFEAGVDQQFTTVLSTGIEVPICPDGETIKVTKSNIDEFCDKVLEIRANEAKDQVEAIRLGFLTVIQNNEDVLTFCDWETLESRCTGEKIISVERLKSITSYNCAADHPIVARFWRVFESFTEIERRNYLKFVWGRARLPIDLTNISRKHEVRLMQNMNITAFPQSHTCFFQLDVPNYETDEIMRSRLVTACELCGEIDTDNNAAQDLD